MMSSNLNQLTSERLSALFGYAHSLFRNPSTKQHEWLLSSECQCGWRELSGIFELGVSHLAVPRDYGEYAEQFIATFDVGTPNPPVPLIESHYNKRDPIPRILHENILFYRQFGLQLRDSAMENADHLRHQLECAQHLLQYRARLETSGPTSEAAQATHALRDFVTRHLSSWVGEAARCARDAPLEIAEPALRLVESLCALLINPGESAIAKFADGATPT
jgi:TorA maturation chaperone TorD